MTAESTLRSSVLQQKSGEGAHVALAQGCPPKEAYSANTLHGVADMCLSSTVFWARPARRRSEKFCRLRAPPDLDYIGVGRHAMRVLGLPEAPFWTARPCLGLTSRSSRVLTADRVRGASR